MTTPSDDDALGAPGLAAARRHGQGLPDELVDHVAHTLDMTTGQATEWIGARLNGHTVRSVDKYIRTCVENYSPPALPPDLDKVDHCGECGEDDDGNKITGTPEPVWIEVPNPGENATIGYCDECFDALRKAGALAVVAERWRNRHTGRTVKPKTTTGRTQS